jgi:hypothetical protein
MKRPITSLIVLIVLTAGCAGSGGSPITSIAATSQPLSDAGAASTTTSPPPASTTLAVTTTTHTPDLSDRPLIWFGPLPPLPQDAGRPFTGAEDFFALFAPDAAWKRAAGYTDVFLLYAEWVAWHASPGQLETVVAALNRLGLALAVEGSPLARPADCGTGIESWGGIPEGVEVARKIQDAGGTIDLWAMDAPLGYAHVVHGPRACGWSQEEIAKGIAEFTAVLQGYFPEIIVGDTEPLWADFDSVGLYSDWLDTFARVNGYGLPFFHLDVDWGRPDWSTAAGELEAASRARGIDFGIFYIGNWDDFSDRAWISLAGERVKAYEQEARGNPDHVLFQSWHDHPDRSLPESEPWTFTSLINTYVESPAELGVQTTGPGANLAFGASTIASVSLEGLEAGAAVDGDSGTWWGAGDFAPQWIEIDLGSEQEIAEIRLRVSQSPEGATVHLVKAGPDTNHLSLIHTFDGVTRDLGELVFAPPQPLSFRVLRIETTESPSWVAWREVEVLAAG